LDFCFSLQETLALAPAVEQLGYSRFWLAEHQPQPSPMLIATLVGGLTDTIRVGTAGILLHYYTPAKAAFDFHLLEAAYPGRMDAGFCAGRCATPGLVDDLLDGRPAHFDPPQYRRRVGSLIDYLRRTPRTVEKPDWRTTWAAASYAPPQIWVHGSGRGAVECALEHGLALGLSILHHNANPDPALAREYRRRFVTRDGQEQPLLALAVSGICAPTTAQAEALYASHEYRDVRANILGDPQRWQDELAMLQASYQPDVIIVLDLCRHYEDRLASYTLLAEAMRLPEPAS
jgi:alkanesulfonate monooxygenase SsuD/methylene tetrahydromethanopterin reductase-like flavin-dependent oxidoreductase (luciferase family)